MNDAKKKDLLNPEHSKSYSNIKEIDNYRFKENLTYIYKTLDKYIRTLMAVSTSMY